MTDEQPLIYFIRKIALSLALGVLGLIINLHSLTFSYLNLDLNLSLGYVFPLLISLAWGNLFALPSVLITSLFVFSQSRDGGGSMVYLYLVYTLWVPLIGRMEQKRKWASGNRFIPYYALFLYSVLVIIGYLLIYNLITPRALPKSTLFIYSYGDNMTMLSCLNLGNLLLMLPPVRYLLDLEKQSELKTRMGYYYILGALLGLFLVWGLTLAAETLIESRTLPSPSSREGRMAELLLNHLLYLNLIIVLAIALFRNWELQSDTERKIIERKDILEQIMSKISEGVLLIDGEWKVRYANAAAMALGNYTVKDLGKSINRVVSLYSADSGKPFSHKDAVDLLTSEEAVTCLLNTGPGKFRRIVITLLPLKEKKYGFCYLSLIRDITEAYEQEQKNIHTQKQEAIGRLVGGVSHDFNNRLAGIMGFAQLIYKTRNMSEIRYYADQIVASAESASDLTSQLLTLSRKRPLKRTRFSLNDLVRSLVPLLNHTISKGIRIQTSLSEYELIIEGDRSLMENALLNLAINGAYAMKRKGTLSLETALRHFDEAYCLRSASPITPGVYGVIRIYDTGTGISGEIMEKIFDPFFTTKKEGEGTGLGLSTVKEIVEKHKGEIQVSSVIGEGTVFTISLPLAQERESAMAPMTSG